MTAFYKEWKHSGAYVKTLCDLHGMSQFSIAFDVYLQLIANVDSLVDKVLHCNSPNWHLKHCCLACTYTLEGEQPLQFSIQYALDGNDSLKHIHSTKHPLTIISKLLEVVGKDFGSPLGLLACSLNHTCLVSTFDGHAH
ncbi:hypothetical protein EDD16DRAFT_1689007 [Pisolithus croceorrhizus]|nr:hypothetical protein EDD16DRAFT_1689007 [Pisolithus croceorrhizus]